MIPSVDIRLASMTTALTGAIMPALDPANASAAEQAALLAGHIAVLRAQLPYAEEFEHLDYNRVRAYGQELLDGVEGGEQTTAAAETLHRALGAPVPFTLPQLRAAHDTLEMAVADLIEAGGRDGTPAYAAASLQVCLRQERAQSIRCRSWFSAMGYEDGSTPIPALEEMMAEFRSAYGAST